MTPHEAKFPPCPCGDNDGKHCSLAGCPYPAPRRNPRSYPGKPAGFDPDPASVGDYIFVAGLAVVTIGPWVFGLYSLAVWVWGAL